MIDLSDEIIQRLAWARQDAVKAIFEISGFNFGETTNKLDYHNRMIENPLKIGGPGGGADWGEGPAGFYTDEVLYNFITRAEGPIGVQWVRSKGGHDVATECACFGYDFPGGVHDASFIKRLGLTPADTEGIPITNRGRLPIGAEYYGGKVQWGWYTSPLPKSHPYWGKLIPVYREHMIWAWNQPEIQAVMDPAERLARMHSVNWWGYHNMKLFHGGSGWNHRLQAAQEALRVSGKLYN